MFTFARDALWLPSTFHKTRPADTSCFSYGEEAGFPFLWAGAQRLTSASTIPLRGTVFDWERLNPSGFPGNGSLDNVQSGLM